MGLSGFDRPLGLCTMKAASRIHVAGFQARLFTASGGDLDVSLGRSCEKAWLCLNSQGTGTKTQNADAEGHRGSWCIFELERPGGGLRQPASGEKNGQRGKMFYFLKEMHARIWSHPLSGLLPSKDLRRETCVCLALRCAFCLKQQPGELREALLLAPVDRGGN